MRIAFQVYALCLRSGELEHFRAAAHGDEAPTGNGKRAGLAFLAIQRGDAGIVQYQIGVRHGTPPASMMLRSSSISCVSAITR
jgi:hypothetical protein